MQRTDSKWVIHINKERRPADTSFITEKRLKLERLISHRYFDNLMLGVTMINVLALSCYHYQVSSAPLRDHDVKVY